MKPKRRKKLEETKFHNVSPRADELKTWFDIDLFDGIGADDAKFAVRMFHRRHVYEHNGGEVDERYIRESGDRSVRVKQALHETSETAFKTAGLVVKMGRNLHEGFHEIFPAVEMPIRLWREQQARIKVAYGGRGGAEC